MYKPKLYIAAPLFSQAELEFNSKLKKTLSSVFDVYLPQDDGCLYIEEIKKGCVPEKFIRAKIFNEDTRAILECDVFLIVLDGRAIDEGACFELGYAYANDKYCVGLKTDSRQLLEYGNNPMIECGVKYIFKTIKEFKDWVYKYYRKE